MIHPALDKLKPAERAQIRVVVAMSGGVDSSVAAALLKQQGFNVIGMALKTYELPKGTASREKSCCSLDDMEDARRVTEKIGMPFYVINTKEEFEQRVIEPFIHQYLAGRTPNPCINCNTFIKFDFLLNQAMSLGADFVATGHYAHLSYDGDSNRVHLHRARDAKKDQSYFLYNLTQEQLKRTLFPLGVMTKEEVRKLADSLELPVAKKAESQEICFVNDNKYVEFIEKRVAKDFVKDGLIKRGGKTVGKHEGIFRFTIGQRKGLGGLSGLTDGDNSYVTEIDPLHNVVHVGPESALMKNALLATNMNWIVDPALVHDRDLLVKVRSGSEPVSARVSIIADNQVVVRFAKPQRAITPGQGLCVFDDSEVLGGGWIERAYYLDPRSDEFQVPLH